MKIGTFDLEREALLIAEIGNNHEGDPREAMALAAAAVEAGAQAVKVQVIDPRRLVAETQVERIRQLEGYRLGIERFAEMARYVRGRGALFMASAFDVESLLAIAPHLDAVKVASGDLDFHPLLEAAMRVGKPVVLSTGMATLDEIEAALGVARAAAGGALRERLALLHCVSLYPTQPAQANLAAMATLRDRFGLVTGYSDHTLGIEVAAMAVGAGARIVEKHFTLDKARSGFRDHALSADPQELARLAVVVRNAAAIFGSGRRDETAADRPAAAAVRRSIVAARALPAGHVLAAGDLDYLRPGQGISPSRAREVIGRRLRRALERQAPLRMEDLE
jgi:N-acetylneuraminate synthase/N,N'-diacetyllegionaminate synthase